MIGEATQRTDYDPFVRGRFPVGVRTFEAPDAARSRVFPCEVWYPAATETRDAAGEPGIRPLIVYSHPSQYHRAVATFLCTHLASHGYVVAAMNHSEVAAPELGRRADETAEERSARMNAVIASRVPDVQFLLDRLLNGAPFDSAISLDTDRIGIVGHSFGGWTALAVPDVEPRIRAVVALAPGGASHPRPGILPLHLEFRWGRDVPTLYLVAEDDAALPLPGMYELFDRTPATKKMVVLRRADHVHFIDDIEREHENFRTAPLASELAAIQRDMKPFAELTSVEQSHRFTRGLTLCHFDAFLRADQDACRFLDGDLESELSRRGVNVFQPLRYR